MCLLILYYDKWVIWLFYCFSPLSVLFLLPIREFLVKSEFEYLCCHGHLSVIHRLLLFSHLHRLRHPRLHCPLPSRSMLKFLSIELVMLSNCLILCHPLLLLPSFFRSSRVFSNEAAPRIRWPKYWSFSFSISLSGESVGWL